MTIRAIVFDWGGVIQRTIDRAPRAALDRELGLSPGTVEAAVFGSASWERASIGLARVDDVWSEVAAAVGYPAERVGELVERFFAGDRIDERLVALVRELRAQGYRVGLLSNAPPPRTKGRTPLAIWGMEELFDVQVFSHEVGALKPDPRMYRAILEALDVPAAEALFIDDAPKNIEGARRVGMEALLFRGAEELLDELRRRGLWEDKG